MKTLVVYYSRTGATKEFAEEIAKCFKADLEEIIDLKRRKGAIGWIVSGKDASLKKLTKINELKKDVSKYDLVIIGSPTWAGSVTPAIRTFIHKCKSNLKKVAFYSVRAGPNPGNVIAQMEELSGKKPLFRVSFRTIELKNKSYSETIDKIVKDFKK